MMQFKLTICLVLLISSNLIFIKCQEEGSVTYNSRPTQAQIYGYGTLAILFISALAWLGIILLPCFNQKIYFQILKVLSALAVGTLLSDAMMHMIPEVLNPPDPVPKNVIHVPHYIFNIIVIMSSIYLFWIFETITHHSSGKHTTNHSHSHSNVASSEVARDLSENKSENDAEQTHFQQTERASMTLKQRFFDFKNLKNIRATGWMILVGDALHNFADGVAVGASFANSLTMGLSTTIAVIVHEIPHELGNYAVLVRSGFDHIQALVFNFISALTCLIGFYIGASIGANDEASVWIFSITAGMFIYIALVDLLPSITYDVEWNWIMFLICNIAMLLGWTIMFLLVIFEAFI